MRNRLSVILIVLLSVLATGCTGKQYLRYVDAVLSGHQAEADAAARQYEQERAEDTAGRPCPELYDLARSAGFSREQWREPLSRILWRESHCQGGANNPISTADGVAQIVRGTWRASCPDLPYEQRYDPEVNLECAYRVWSNGGWSAWATY